MKNGQLRMGIKVEGEHARTYKFISKYVKQHKRMPPKKLVFINIAKDHLKENKKYYSKLKKAKL